jgi:hypothetical protein
MIQLVLNTRKFFTIWAFIIHILGFRYNFSTNQLAQLVFNGGIILNMYYLHKYNFKINMARIPFELIFHILPLIISSKSNNILQSFKEKLLIFALIIMYFYTYNIVSIYKLYLDPIKYLKIDKYPILKKIFDLE